MIQSTHKKIAYILIAITLFANTFCWNNLRHEQEEWLNISKPPSVAQASRTYLADNEFAFRNYALNLQNFGDIGGRTMSLQKYNYENLHEWLIFLDDLNSKSSFSPLIAAYYYSATQNPEQLDVIIDFLERVGKRPYGENWRWLVQAIFLAKHVQKDNDKALRLANIVAKQYREEMPSYVKRMPAFITAEIGDKQMAYEMLMGILTSNVDKADKSETMVISEYICQDILTQQEALEHPLCGAFILKE